MVVEGEGKMNKNVYFRTLLLDSILLFIAWPIILLVDGAREVSFLARYFVRVSIRDFNKFYSLFNNITLLYLFGGAGK
jgi:hypothetical protein